jgi:hypothetical protein
VVMGSGAVDAGQISLHCVHCAGASICGALKGASRCCFLRRIFGALFYGPLRRAVARGAPIQAGLVRPTPGPLGQVHERGAAAGERTGRFETQ